MRYKKTTPYFLTNLAAFQSMPFPISLLYEQIRRKTYAQFKKTEQAQVGFQKGKTEREI